jgi:ketosteroid isomerase-like protein
VRPQPSLSPSLSRGLSPGLFALALAALCACAAPQQRSQASAAEVGQVLDGFHQAASKCDLDGYFRHFSARGVFLGTDATEHWTREEFRAFCAPYFARGQGWTYTPTTRSVDFSSAGDVAWFDELLHNEKYGEVRGSGVLVRRAGAWWIEQYVMSFTVPNELAGRWLEVRRSAATPAR